MGKYKDLQINYLEAMEKIALKKDQALHEEYNIEQVMAWLLQLAPDCKDCEFTSGPQHDPLGTGDSPTEYGCLVPACPWGKR